MALNVLVKFQLMHCTTSEHKNIVTFFQKFVILNFIIYIGVTVHEKQITI